MPTLPTPVRAPVALALLATLAACAGAGSPAAPAGDPYVRGPVESILTHATGTGILVRPTPGSADSCGINAVADARTRYLRRTGTGALERATLGDLQAGDTVEVYVDGPVAESCPAQGRAADVVLVARGTP